MSDDAYTPIIGAHLRREALRATIPSVVAYRTQSEQATLMSHQGELVRESMDRMGWSVTETAARLSCDPRHAVAPAERAGERVGQHGPGAGGNRLGYGRTLDATAGDLRSGAGAPGTGHCRRADKEREVIEDRNPVTPVPRRPT